MSCQTTLNAMSADEVGTATPHRVRVGFLTIAILSGLFTAGASLASPLRLFGPRGDTNDQRRQSIQQDSEEMLNELFAARPEMRQRVRNAAGYATFNRTNVHLFLVASGNGFGVLVNNQTGRRTYMRVAALGGGVGLGVNNLRVIFVFNDAEVMRQFADQGWQFGGNADATAMLDNVGATANHTVKANTNFKDGTVTGGASSNVGAGAGPGAAAGSNISSGGPMEIFQFTRSGLALQATVSGTKFWRDSALNN